MELTIEQQRAKFALESIKKLQKLEPKNQKEFISYASGLPAMIHMNGLGQAMAFCKLKGKDKDHVAYNELYQIVSKWICQQGQPYQDKTDILEGITQCDMVHYQLAQAETIVFMGWVKKFAKAFLAEDNQ